MNQELINYIRENLSKGIPEDQIRQTLASSGWQQADIVTAFLQLQAPPSSFPPFPINSSSTQNPQIDTKYKKTTLKPKFLIVGLIIFIFLVSAGGGVYLYFTKKSGPVKTEVNQESAINQDIENCNGYKDVQKQFCIQPPGGWVKFEETPNGTLGADTFVKFENPLADTGIKANVSVGGEPIDSITFEQLVEQIKYVFSLEKDTTILGEKRLKINAEDAFQLDLKEGNKFIRSVYFLNLPYVYGVRGEAIFGSQEKYNPIFDVSIQSFRFQKQKSQEIKRSSLSECFNILDEKLTPLNIGKYRRFGTGTAQAYSNSNPPDDTFFNEIWYTDMRREALYAQSTSLGYNLIVNIVRYREADSISSIISKLNANAKNKKYSDFSQTTIKGQQTYFAVTSSPDENSNDTGVFMFIPEIRVRIYFHFANYITIPATNVKEAEAVFKDWLNSVCP